MLYFLVGFVLFVVDFFLNLYRGSMSLSTFYSILWKNVLVWPLVILNSFVETVVRRLVKPECLRKK